MPKYTPNLNIQLADPATDGNQTFNIETMINDPVEKLDEALGLVPVCGDVRAATTGNIVLNGAQTIDGIALAAGNRVLVKNQTAGKENGIYTVAAGPWTRTADADTTAKLAAGVSVYVEEGTANGKSRWQMANTGAVTLDTTALIFEKTGGPGSATDTVIGSRTISDATAPTGDSGTVTTLLGWLANMVKAITGGATWRTLPAMSIAAIKAVLDAATHAATASALMKRDANGRAQVAAPAAAGDIARKDTVDGAIAVHKAESNPHTGYVVKTGDTMSGLLVVPGIAAVKDGDAIVTIEDTGAPSNSFRIKQLFSSRNAAEGNVWLFRSVRPSDSKITDVQLRGPEGIPTTIPLSTYSDMTFYVRTDGNDNNLGTANTAAGAFRTIGRAISMIPQIVNHTVTINVGAGTYDEDVMLDGYTGKNAVINLLGDTVVSTSRTIKSLTISNCAVAVIARGFNITTTTSNQSIAAVRTQYAGLSYMSIVQSATTKHGIYAVSAVVFISNSTISNKGMAFAAEQGSRVTASNNTGTGNGVVFSSASGSIVAKANTTPTGTTLEQVITGGVILQEAGVINPWGDNTQLARSAFRLNHGTSQTLSAGVFTKVQFLFNDTDILGEVGGGRFTAKHSGGYIFNAGISLDTVPAHAIYALALYRNGSIYRTMERVQLGTNNANVWMVGSAQAELNAGDYIELYAFSSVSTSTINNGVENYFDGIRIR